MIRTVKNVSAVIKRETKCPLRRRCGPPKNIVEVANTEGWPMCILQMLNTSLKYNTAQN
ncbi:MAG: hypothetical protein CFH10_00433 [Alphaproteobacteria bacterium MarineAlpha4_Bin2]|nr:MAG: hypothetical protein CFH10_00433 [Alphaproteobacteria bacterium MarineAlpha4_Bin2]